MEDNELVERAQNGDEEAFNALIHRYSNAVYGTAYQRLGDFHLAQDTAQEVFLKAYRKLKYLRDPAKVGSWLYSMTQRLAIDWIRSNKVSAPLEQAVTSISSPPDTMRLEVWHAINTLSPLSRLPVILTI